MNDYCERPQSEPKIAAIKKSESSWENICPPQEMHVIHQVEDGALVLETVPTTVVRDQPELIVIKEEPSEVDIWGSGPKTELINENGAATSLDTDVGCLDVLQHCPDSSDNHPILTESQVNHSTQPLSGVQSEDLDTHWTPPACSQSQDVQQITLAAQRSSITGNSSGGITNVPSQSFSVAKSNMKIHSLRTSGAKRFGCMHCGKNFRCSSQLEIHQRSHTGEKPYRCTLCGKRYAQKGHLYTHQRTHTGEKPYRCLDCGKSFIQKCTLDMHQRTHTGEKPYVCVKCGKGFTKNCNLKKHMGVHTEFSMHVYSESSLQEDRWTNRPQPY